MAEAASKSPPRLSDAQRLAWLRLIRSENVGPRTFGELVNHYGGASAALAALGELSRRGGRRRPVRVAGEDEALAEIEAVEACGAELAGPLEPGYPPLLRQIEDRPPLLVVKGRRDLAGNDAVAIVGARNASALGIKISGRIAGELGEAGLVVASGLPAASTRRPIAPASPPGPSPCSPAASTSPTRRRTRTCRRRSRGRGF